MVDCLVLSYFRMQTNHVTIHVIFFLSFMLSVVLSKVYLNVSFSSDLDNSFLDICSEGEQLVETEKNIILNRTGQHFVECNCFVRGEKFSMSVDDLRLQSKLGENCSLFTVSITSTRFSCEQGEVSIFKRKMENWLEDALISVILNGIDAVPQMIWITLKPHGG